MKDKQLKITFVQSKEESIDIGSLIDGKEGSPDYRKGFVEMTMLGKTAVLSVDGARALSLRLIECASAAENDELVLKFLMDHVNMPIEASLLALRDMRSMRPKSDGLPEEASQ